MNTPTIYTATPADLSPPVQTDSFCVDLVLATDYQKLKDEFKQLAAENVALKNVFGPGDAVLNFLTIALRHTTYDQIDLDDVSLAFKMSLPETPATDRIVAGINADGVEQAANECYGAGYIYETLLAYAQQMRKGDK